jgi:hypothetical protein
MVERQHISPFATPAKAGDSCTDLSRLVGTRKLEAWRLPMKRTLLHLVGAGLLALALPASLAHAQTAVDCYFDSVAGDNGKSGLSEAEARQDYAQVPSTCTVAKYKRGSVWNLASGDTLYPPKKAGGTGGATSKIKTLTNYGDESLPLPKFVKQREWNNGGMVSAMQGGLTIDGIYMAGAMSDAGTDGARGKRLERAARTRLVYTVFSTVCVPLVGTREKVRGSGM